MNKTILHYTKLVLQKVSRIELRGLVRLKIAISLFITTHDQSLKHSTFVIIRSIAGEMKRERKKQRKKNTQNELGRFLVNQYRTIDMTDIERYYMLH